MDVQLKFIAVWLQGIGPDLKIFGFVADSSNNFSVAHFIVPFTFICGFGNMQSFVGNMQSFVFPEKKNLISDCTMNHTILMPLKNNDA